MPRHRAHAAALDRRRAAARHERQVPGRAAGTLDEPRLLTGGDPRGHPGHPCCLDELGRDLIARASNEVVALDRARMLLQVGHDSGERIADRPPGHPDSTIWPSQASRSPIVPICPSQPGALMMPVPRGSRLTWPRSSLVRTRNRPRILSVIRRSLDKISHIPGRDQHHRSPRLRLADIRGGADRRRVLSQGRCAQAALFTAPVPRCDARHILWTPHAAECRRNLRSTCGRKILRPPRRPGEVASDLLSNGRDGRI